MIKIRTKYYHSVKNEINMTKDSLLSYCLNCDILKEILQAEGKTPKRNSDLEGMKALRMRNSSANIQNI